MTADFFEMLRTNFNYLFLILESGMLILLILRRKHIPKTIFWLLFAIIIFWINDSIGILTHYSDFNKTFRQYYLMIAMILNYILNFGIFYFYIVPEKWKYYLRYLYFLGIVVFPLMFYVNNSVLKVYLTFITEAFEYFVITTLAILSIFQINEQDYNYRSFASPRFYLNSGLLFFYLSNSALHVFRVQLYELDKSLFFIFCSIQLITWVISCFLIYKAILTFDSEKENLIQSK